METYHKIQTLFKRHMDGPKKGKLIKGQWTTPALEYLSRNQWEFTEKVDGTNIRIGFDHRRLRHLPNPEFGGRTDNAVLPKPLLAKLEDWFHYDLFMDNDLRERVILFGEGYGPKIQNGGNYREDQSFVLFDVNIGGYWLERHNVDDIARKLGIESVPVIGQGTLYDAIDIVESGITFEDSGAVKRWGAGGLKSQWGDFEAEGIVARPMTPLTDRKGDRIITKIKGVDFK
jgi:hypothetical protein